MSATATATAAAKALTSAATTAAAAATTPAAPSYFRVTLRRSAIGLPERTRGVLKALGLRRREQSVYHPVSPDFAGMILKVKELVEVEEADRALTSREMRDARKPDPGFWVEKAVPR
ncbi:39S ribosomal protein L33, mitochondrial [Diatrype stigma]|uniref:Large ribosomal subunit protein uL30m n=1 Tax=Diatrype stigma TaxID=117547 RepID=A0AAN9UAA0_9PEZI